MVYAVFLIGVLSMCLDGVMRILGKDTTSQSSIPILLAAIFLLLDRRLPKGGG